MLLVYNMNNKVYICFDHIIDEGTVEVKDEKKKIVHTHQFINSNYEKVDMKERKGKFTIRINYESETITKYIQL